jgi:hypothetical protein
VVDVVGFAKSAKRNVLGQTLNEFRRLAGQEQFSRDRALRRHVHDNLAAAQFLREEMTQRFNRRLGGRVDAIG